MVADHHDNVTDASVRWAKQRKSSCRRMGGIWPLLAHCARLFPYYNNTGNVHYNCSVDDVDADSGYMDMDDALEPVEWWRTLARFLVDRGDEDSCKLTANLCRSFFIVWDQAS